MVRILFHTRTIQYLDSISLEFISSGKYVIIFVLVLLVGQVFEIIRKSMPYGYFCPKEFVWISLNCFRNVQII